ncbi:MAG: phenylalanine--tRNA ligase subunit beta [Clostridiales bacterium]|nr:phenylalanine--tRNA ligase subunit beta [Clostridiales bacterium]
MKLPLSWLNEYVDLSGISVELLKEKLFSCGFEVEEVIEVNKQVQKIVVCKIMQIDQHPNADKLSVCQIDAGAHGNLQIVTNAKNIKVGDLVPVSLDGAVLADGMQIKKGKLRGVDSDGMFCGGEEIGITEEYYDGASFDGVLVFHDDFPLGADVSELLNTKDVVFDIGVTANRPDCQSVLGLAREVAVILDRPLKEPSYDYTQIEAGAECPITVTVEDGELCPRYCAKYLKDVVIKPSPKWMQRRLAVMGIRAINNIVDITNYVLLEMGQPMHAFNADFLAKNAIIVRRAENGEKIVTLDEKEFTLTSENLLICDGEKGVALAGIMGGKDSGIADDTKNILFECAKFKRDNVRKTSKSLGQRSDSSARFEKGVDSYTVERALCRALNLIEQTQSATICGKTVDVLNEELNSKVIKTSYESINKVLGVDVANDIQKGILESLGFVITESGNSFEAVVPAWRDDVDDFPDLAEEIIRIYGYDHIECRLLENATITNGGKTQRQLNEDRLKNALIAKGFNETLTYSFVSEKDYETFGLDKDAPENAHVKIMNPLGEDMSVMRTTLIPSMVYNMVRNLNKKNLSGRLFELSKVYLPKALPLTELPVENARLTLGVFGDKEDFFTVKGVIEELLEFMHIGSECVYERADAPYLHPGRCAKIICGEQVLGVFGEIHPQIREKLGVDKRIYVAELDYDAIDLLLTGKIGYKHISRFPSVERDLALIADIDTPNAEIVKLICARGGKNLQSVKLFDVYTGKGVEEGKKSVAYRLTFSSLEKTFGEGEVDSFIKKILFFLDQNNIKLR